MHFAKIRHEYYHLKIISPFTDFDPEDGGSMFLGNVLSTCKTII
jgi:hypothetical protein